jgi:pyruvate,orthophosphate dikinase
MSKAGVPVPPGYTITTDTCRYYYANGKKLPKELAAQSKRSHGQARKGLGKNSATTPTPFSFPSAPAPSSPCPA